MSLSLCGLKTCVMSVVAVTDLYLTGSRYRKSLGRSLMCLDFSHFSILLFEYHLQNSGDPQYLTVLIPSVRFELEGGERYAHKATVKHGGFIRSSEIGTFVDKLRHDFLTDGYVAHLSALKAHNNSDLVTV